MKETNGYVRFTLDKLCGIRADLVRTDDNWQRWGFNELIEAVRKWTKRNPIERLERSDRSSKKQHRRGHIMQTHQSTKTTECVYCGSKDHKPTACTRIQDINKRRKIISSKKLCFNCIGEGHRASNCKSKRSCRKCKGHYTSLCIDATSQQSPTTRTESDNPTIRQELLTTSENEAIYPVAVVKVNCITCRALPDTGAGSSYISSTLRTDYTNSIIRTDYKQIETMLHTTNTLIDIYDVEITITKCDFTINTEVSKLDRAELTSMPNPHYEDIKTYTHLQ